LLGISCIILRVVIKGVGRGLLTLFIVTIPVVQGNRPPCAPLLLLVLLVLLVLVLVLLLLLLLLIVVVVARLIRGQVASICIGECVLFDAINTGVTVTVTDSRGL
jgi:hypothetical protein